MQRGRFDRSIPAARDPRRLRACQARFGSQLEIVRGDVAEENTGGTVYQSRYGALRAH